MLRVFGILLVTASLGCSVEHAAPPSSVTIAVKDEALLGATQVAAEEWALCDVQVSVHLGVPNEGDCSLEQGTIPDDVEARTIKGATCKILYRSSPRLEVLAHEIGHALWLPHVNEGLMQDPAPTGAKVTPRECEALRRRADVVLCPEWVKGKAGTGQCKFAISERYT